MPHETPWCSAELRAAEGMQVTSTGLRTRRDAGIHPFPRSVASRPVDDDTELCACGEQLHYTDPMIEDIMRRRVARLGPMVVVETLGGAWQVPRHFIVLHGLRAEELPGLAIRYGFPHRIASGWSRQQDRR